MALNGYGIGFNVTAEDSATPTLTSVSNALTKVSAQATTAGAALDKVSKGGTAALDAAAKRAAAAASLPTASVPVPSAAPAPVAGGGYPVAGGGYPGAGGAAPPMPSPHGGGLGGDAAKSLVTIETWRQAREQLTRLSQQLTQFGQTVSYVFEAGTAAAVGFGAGIAELTTLVPEAQFAVEDMRGAIFSMSQQFGGSMHDQIRAMYQGISAGAADAAGSVALLTQANKLAIGGATDVRTAVDGLTNVLNAYGMTYTKENLAGISDAFFVGLSKGKTTAAELAASLGLVAPSAAAAGVSMSDLVATVSAITTKGINTAQAITGIKAALAVISHPAKEATDEAKRLGIEFSEAAIRAKGFPAFLESITKNAKYNSDSMTKLFGGSIEAKNAMLALAGGGTAFNDTLNAMKTRMGATDAAFQKMADSPAFQGQLFQGLKEQARVIIGEAIMPLHSMMLKIGVAILRAFTSAPPALRKFAVYVMGAVGALATFLGGVFGATAAIAGIVIAGKAALIAFGAVAAVIAVMALAIVPLIAAISTLYLIWTRNIGGIQTQVTVWAEKVSLAFRAITQLISTGTLSGALQEELGTKANGHIKGFAITVYMWFARIRNFFSNIGKAFTEGLKDLGPLINDIAQAFQSLVSDLVPVSKTGSEAKTVFQQFGAAGLAVGKALVTVVGWVLKGFLNIIQFARGVKDTFMGFGPALSGVWDAAKALGEAFSSVFAIILGGDASAKSSADTWRMLGQVLGTMLTIAVYSVATALRVAAGVFSWIGGIIGAVRVVFDGLVNGIALGIEFVGALLTGNWSQAWDLMRAIVDNAINTIVQTMLKLVAGAAGMIDSLGKIFGKDPGLKVGVEQFAASDSAKSNFAPAAKPKNASPSVDTSKMAPSAPLKEMDTYAPVGAAPTIDRQRVGYPTLPVASSTANPSAQPGAQPSGSDAQTQAALKNLATQKQQPAEVHVKNTVVLDGSVIAENTSKHQAQNSGRSFEPLPSPT